MNHHALHEARNWRNFKIAEAGRAEDFAVENFGIGESGSALASVACASMFEKQFSVEQP